jgi:hypothetical protein
MDFEHESSRFSLLRLLYTCFQDDFNAGSGARLFNLGRKITMNLISWSRLVNSNRVLGRDNKTCGGSEIAGIIMLFDSLRLITVAWWTIYGPRTAPSIRSPYHISGS